jgi:hypothetical protein
LRSFQAWHVFAPMGLRVRRNRLGCIVFLLRYQLLCSTASLAGYGQHLAGAHRRWKWGAVRLETPVDPFGVAAAESRSTGRGDLARTAADEPPTAQDREHEHLGGRSGEQCRRRVL